MNTIVKSVTCCIIILSIVWIQGCDDSTPVNHGLNVTTELIMPGGTHPVWMPDGESFLASYGSITDSTGIYIVNLNSHFPQKLWDGNHNYDYSATPGGSFIIFSSPEINAGVYIHEMGGSTRLAWPGGQRPSWVYVNREFVCESASGSIIHVSSQGQLIRELSAEGLYPVVSPNQPYVAFLVGYFGDVRLRVAQLSDDPQPVTIAAGYIPGTDFVWGGMGHDLYFSALQDGPLSIIGHAYIETPSDVVTIMTGACFPTVTDDGNYVIADRLDGEEQVGFYLYDVDSGDQTPVNVDGYHAVAGPLAKVALYESDDGIYSMRW